MTSPSQNQSDYKTVSKRVLIVEDEPLIAYDLRTEIEDNNHKVIGLCNSASSAIEMAGDLRPDVIVMDISLHGDQSGIEAGLEIRQQFDIGCIYVSATLDRVNPEVWNDIRPIALIPKPYRDETLARAILADEGHWEIIEPSAKPAQMDQALSENERSNERQLRSQPRSHSKSAKKTN